MIDAGLRTIDTPPRFRRSTRLPACFVFLLLWGCASFLVWEAYERLRSQRPAIAPVTIPYSMTAARQLFRPVYARYATENPVAVPPVPSLSDFLAGDTESRSRIASMRGEWIGSITPEGMILESYGTPPRGLPLDRLAAGACLTDAANPDFGTAIMQVIQAGFAHDGVYPSTIPLNAAEETMLLCAVFLKNRQDTGTRCGALALSPSIYRYGVKRFVPDIAPRTFDATIMMEQFSTNSLGWRGPEIVIPKPAGTLRIACIGGSTTVWGYTDELTYPAILQHMLRTAFPGQAHRIEVINCGVFGLLTAEEPELIDEIAGLEPDILVHYNFINDIGIQMSRWTDDPESWPALRGKARRLLRHSRALKRHMNHRLLPPDSEIDRMLRETVLAPLKDVAVRAERHGIVPVFCTFDGPEPERIPRRYLPYANTELMRIWFSELDLLSYTRIRDRYNRLLQRYCEREHLLCIPIAETLDAGFDLYLDLCHFNPYGTEKQAEVVFRHLRAVVDHKLLDQPL